MRKSCDVVLVGTGLATLVAAHQFLQQGKKVVLLNPDRDYFLENSELPFDPLWLRTDAKVSPKRLRRSLPDHVLQELRGAYPGLIEYWTSEAREPSIRDPDAPWVRSRGRMWLRSEDREEDLWHRIYVEAADAGLKPLELQGLSAVSRVAGMEHRSLKPRDEFLSRFEGILIPNVCDMDVLRYRRGFLEFLRQKLKPEEMIEGVSDITAQDKSVRFYAGGEYHRLEVTEGVIVFWTPRLSTWIRKSLAPLSSKESVEEFQPNAVRIWEEWTLVSKTPVTLDTIASYGDLFAWGDVEQNRTLLRVLRAGEMLNEGDMLRPQAGQTWVSEKSFVELSRFCLELLGWEKFSIRSLEMRSIFEWRGGKGGPEFQKFWQMPFGGLPTYVIHGCDGPISEVVHRAQQSSAVFSGVPI